MQHRSITLRSLAASLTLLAFAGCQDGDPTEFDRVADDYGVIHLDPRLVDGGATGPMLASTVRPGVSWANKKKRTPLLQDWSVSKGTLVRGNKGDGLVLRATQAEGGPLVFPKIQHTGGIESTRVNSIRLRVRAAGVTSAEIRWLTQEDALEGKKTSGSQSESIKAFGGGVDVDFNLAGHSDWSGRIVQLDITPSRRESLLKRPVMVEEIHFSYQAFAPGDDQIGDDPDHRDSGDGGLVVINSQARRTWPSDVGVPLLAECTVPPGGRFEAWVAIPANMTVALRDDPVFQLDVRGDSPDWAGAATLSVDPSDAGEWSKFEADLSKWEGEEVELRLLGFLGGLTEVREHETPRRASILWGEPIVTATPSESPRPNVILITLDTLRASAVGCYGGPYPTPNLDRLASEGFQFTESWSGSPSTAPSHTSILTGSSVMTHGVRDNYSRLAPRFRTLAEEFREAGYQTAAAVSVAHLATGQSGLGQGFDRFLTNQPNSNTNGGITLESVESWLEEWSHDRARPIFLWVHFFDPHTPYGPPKDYMKRWGRRNGVPMPPKLAAEGPRIPPHQWTKPSMFLEGVDNPEYAEFLYNSGVGYADHLTGRLLDDLEGAGLLENACIAVTSDHGDAHGEHDVWYAHKHLFPETLEVPLILKLPEGNEGRQIGAIVQNLDLHPTLLEVAGIQVRGNGQSESLLPMLRNSDETVRRLWHQHNQLKEVATWDQGFYFIAKTPGARLPALEEGDFALYDWVNDPEMSHDISGENSEEVARQYGLLKEWWLSTPRAEVTSKTLSASAREELEALGYIEDED